MASDPFADAGWMPAPQPQFPAGAQVNAQPSDPFAQSGWVAAPAQQAVPQAAPSHPVASEQGQSFWTNLKRAAGTAGINTLSSLSGAGAQDPAMAGSGAMLPPDVRAAMTPAGVRENLYRETGATEFQPKGLPWQAGAGAINAVTNQAAMPIGGLAKTLLPAAAGGALAPAIEAAAPNMPPWLAKTLGFGVGAAAGGMLGNMAVRPFTGATVAAGKGMEPEVAALAASRPADMPLGLTQTSNSEFWKRAQQLASKVPWSGGETLANEQQPAWNRWLGSLIGEPNTSKLTADVFDRARERIGGTLDAIGARTGVYAGGKLVNDLADIESQAAGTGLTEAEFSPIRTQLNNVISKVGPGDMISGADYQGLTRFGTPLGIALKSANPNIRYFAGQIRGALDDAMQQSVSPQDAIALQQARQQWKALVAIEPLTLRADTIGGATPSTGDISPAALLGQVKKVYGEYPSKYGPGGQDLLNAARFGQRFLKPPGSSGTTENLLTAGAGGELLAGVGGALLGHGYEPGLGAAGTMGASLLGARGMNALLRNQMLVNQAIRASQNPGAFRFNYLPGMGIPQAAPFALAPLTAQDAIQPPR